MRYMHVAGRLLVICCALILTLSCEMEDGKAPISVKLFQAVHAADAVKVPEGFREVFFPGGPHAAGGQYFIATEPLMTEWNILTFREASVTDGSVAVVVRLNEYAIRKLGKFSSDEANIKKPLALQIDGRWADVSPLLSRITDKITLYGFTLDEAERLQQSLKERDLR